MISKFARTCAGAVALLVLVAAAPAAGQEEEPSARPPAPQALVHVFLTGGISLHQNPLTTKFAEVIAGDLRLGVPVAYGLEPWVGGTLAHLRPSCGQGESCPSSETRLLGGLIYRPGIGGGGERGGAYFGGGLGTQAAGGVRKIAYSVVIGLPLGASERLTPLLELRAERHDPVGDLLLIGGGVRFGAVR